MISLRFPSYCGVITRMPFDLGQTVARAGIEIKAVEPLQVLNPFERCGAERWLSVEGMQNNAFQQVTKRHVVEFGESFEHFQQTFFHAYTRLDSFDEELRLVYHSTNVPR